MTTAIFTPDANSPLVSLTGMIGDVIYQSDTRIEMRVPLESHRRNHNSSAIIHCPIDCVRFL